MNQRYVILDATSYLFRAFYALPPLTNSQGEPTGMIAGVAQMLLKLIADYQDIPIIAVMDSGGPTHRHAWFPGYKKNRTQPPPDFQTQVHPVKELIELLGIPLVCQRGIEADDLISKIAHYLVKKDISVIISTPDKDFGQIVSEKIVLHNPVTGQIASISEIESKYGVPINCLPDYFALIGDQSDGIPGVPQVGPKTAATLISQHQTLEKIYENLDSLRPRLKETLLAHRENAFLSRRLFCFQDLPDSEWNVHEWFSSLNHGLADIEKLRSFCKRYELTRLAERLEQHFYLSRKKSESLEPPVDQEISYEEGLLKIKEMIRNKGFVAIALVDGRWSFAGCNEKDRWQFSWTIDPQANDHIKECFAYVGPGCWLSQNWKEHWRQQPWLKPCGAFEDIALLEHYLSSDAPRKIFQKKSANEILDIFFNRKKYLTKMQEAFIQDYEYPLITILHNMEKKGVQIHRQELIALDEDWRKKVDTLKEDIIEIVGQELNINSPQQLRKCLFEDLGLHTDHKTPTGEKSTNEEALVELLDQHPVISLLLDYRKYEKLRSTYTNSWLQKIDEMDRLHTTFHQTATITGRLASLEPNLQNIPVRSEDGSKLRRLVVAPEGKKIVSLDYSQIELRLMAHFSQDENLLLAYHNNADVHEQTARFVLYDGRDDIRISTEDRQIAKTINFGLIYGMSAYGLSRQLRRSVSECQKIIQTYFQKYPGVANYMENMRNLAKSQGYVETLFGRHIPIQQTGRKGSEIAWRAAINGPLQGTASELIKIAMIRLQSILEPEKSDMILQVHDELVFEVDHHLVNQWTQQAKAIMEQVATLRVPLIVNEEIGATWM